MAFLQAGFVQHLRTFQKIVSHVLCKQSQNNCSKCHFFTFDELNFFQSIIYNIFWNINPHFSILIDCVIFFKPVFVWHSILGKNNWKSILALIRWTCNDCLSQNGTFWWLRATYFTSLQIVFRPSWNTPTQSSRQTQLSSLDSRC